MHTEVEVNDGDRELMFWFTNNSDYTIKELNLRYRLQRVWYGGFFAAGSTKWQIWNFQK